MNARAMARMLIPGLVMIAVGVILPVLGFYLNFNLFPPDHYQDHTIYWVAAGAISIVLGFLWCGVLCCGLLFKKESPASESTRCKNCAHGNPPAAKFCSNCGSRVG